MLEAFIMQSGTRTVEPGFGELTHGEKTSWGKKKVDIYPTVKRSGKYLLCRLFWYITYIGLFVPMKSKKKKKKFRKKLK